MRGSRLLVPCVWLCVTAQAGAQGGPVFYRGLPHEALGGATLETACGDCLTVTGIGPSGLDGVSVDPGDAADDLVVSVDIGPSGALPAGMVFTIEMLAAGAPAGGGPASPPLAATISETGGGQASLAADFGFFDPPGVLLVLYLDGVYVTTGVLTPPYPETLLTGALGTVGGSGFLQIDGGDPETADAGTNPYMTIKLSRVIITSLAGGGPPGPIVADEIRLIMTGLPAGTRRPPIDLVEMRAANTREFSLHDERLVKFGNPHLALGQAHLAAGSSGLTISNIDLDGDDGVGIDPDPAGRIAIRFPDIPTGSETIALNYVKFGHEQGNPSNELVSNFSMTGVPGGGALEMHVDFSDYDAVSQLVDVLLDNVVIGSVPGQIGAVGETTSGTECVIWDIKDSCGAGGTNVELLLEWAGPTEMTINGLGLVVADELRIQPELAKGDPDRPIVVGRIYHASVTVADLLSLEILDEVVTPLQPCIADTNDDLVVSTADLLGLLGAWGSSDPTYDIAPDYGDGVVSTADLLELLGAWGPCSVD